MTQQFTASEVRRLSNRIPRSNDEIADAQEALRAYADMLAEREKAAPVAYRAEWNGDVSDEGAYVYCDADDRDFDHQWEPLYTHPAAQESGR